MRITFLFPAVVRDCETGKEVPVPAPGIMFKATEQVLDNFFGNELAESGVIGGEIFITCRNESPIIEVRYWYHRTPPADLIDALYENTRNQLLDGAGEGGFDHEMHGRRVNFDAIIDPPREVEIVEDGRPVPGPPIAAIAARQGDLGVLEAAIEAEPESVQQRLQGFSAVHLAVIYGHLEAVRLLLAAGADPNRKDFFGGTPLQSCATSRHLNDELAREIALLLLNAGADRDHRSDAGFTAKDYAEQRKKPLLAAIL